MLNLTQEELHLILDALNYGLEENRDNATEAEIESARTLYIKILNELLPF